MVRARGQDQAIIAVVMALVAAISIVLALLLHEGSPKDLSSPATPLNVLPGLPEEAPVLAAQAAVDPDDARTRNAADPFFAGKVPPAPPFRLTTMGADFDRARECLALAAMAEAGPTDEGQRAVMQVILNRVRHPAFAKTVCGVVFEGAERDTGCQFSFTCDGSLARQYGSASWDAARARATAMLRGRVYAKVGNATHYHTDWVYPYWSPQLVKLTQVETHLFFRWPGYWGTLAAMRAPYRGGEPEMAALLGGEVESAAPMASFAPLPSDTPKITSGTVAARDPSGRGNFLLIANRNAEQTVANARKLCGSTATCKVLGWTDASAIPATFPVPAKSRASLQFSYARDPSGAEIVLYGCDWFAGIARDQCIPRSR